MGDLFIHRITAAYARVNENKTILAQKEIYLDQLKTQLKETHALSLKKTYMNKKSNTESGIPIAKNNYTDSLRDFLYQLNGFFLLCSGLGTEGLASCDPHIQGKYTELAKWSIRELLHYNKKEYAILALESSNKDFKGLYDVEDMEEKKPEVYAEILVKEIENEIKAETNARDAAEAASLKAAKNAKLAYEMAIQNEDMAVAQNNNGSGNGNGSRGLAKSTAVAVTTKATTAKAKPTGRRRGRGKAKDEENVEGTGAGAGNGRGNGSGSGSATNELLGGGKRKRNTRKLRR